MGHYCVQGLSASCSHLRWQSESFTDDSESVNLTAGYDDRVIAYAMRRTRRPERPPLHELWSNYGTRVVYASRYQLTVAFTFLTQCIHNAGCVQLWSFERKLACENEVRSVKRKPQMAQLTKRLAYRPKFLPRDAMHPRYWPWACVCVCLCLSVSVTSRSSTKTAKRRIMQTPHDSPGTLVFWSQRSPRNSTGVTPYGGAKYRWGGSKSATFHK